MATFQPRLLVEAHAERDQVGDAGRSLLCQSLHGSGPRKTATGAQRVLGMELRAVAGPRRGREAALGEIARRSADRSFRDDKHAPIGGGREGGEEAGDPAAHDDEVVPVSRVH